MVSERPRTMNNRLGSPIVNPRRRGTSRTAARSGRLCRDGTRTWVRAIRVLRLMVVLAGLAVPLCLASSALAAGGEPTVSEASATNITESGATLEAQIDPGGSETTYE